MSSTCAITDINFMYRALIIAGLMATGYTPLFHAYLVGGIERLRYFPWKAAVKMLSADLVGVFFYITRFPENRFPGTFDIWVSLHVSSDTVLSLKSAPGCEPSDLPHHGRCGAGRVSSWLKGTGWSCVRDALYPKSDASRA